MKKWQNIYGVLIVVASLLTISCNNSTDKEPSPDNELDRKPMLENYATNYVVPTYADMQARLSTLKTALATFGTTPNVANHNAAKTALFEAYLQWQRTDVYGFGPAEDAQLRTFINTYPVTVSKVNNNITSGSYDLEAFGNNDAQGFPALDYLLNGLDLDMYTTDAQAASRIKYMNDVAAMMESKMNTVTTNWDTYKNTFINSTGTDASSSLSQMVNNFVLYYERYLRSGKVGIPAGAMTGSALPEHVESLYAPEQSKLYLSTALKTVLDFYAAQSIGGASMKSYYEAIGTKADNDVLMADVIVTEMNEAITSIDNLNGTLYENIKSNKGAVLTAYDELQDVVPLLKVDMVSAFSISITYTDNDGD